MRIGTIYYHPPPPPPDIPPPPPPELDPGAVTDDEIVLVKLLPILEDRALAPSNPAVEPTYQEGEYPSPLILAFSSTVSNFSPHSFSTSKAIAYGKNFSNNSGVL